jgi:hypothetical protein
MEMVLKEMISHEPIVVDLLHRLTNDAWLEVT